MNISSLKATNMELTEAIRTYVNEKLALLDDLRSKGEFVVVSHMEVGKSSQHHKKGPYYFAEIDLQVQKNLFRAREEAEDLYAAIDLAKDELKRQLLNRKDRYVSDQHKPRPGKE